LPAESLTPHYMNASLLTFASKLAFA
jgi:hypothetical protein